MALATPLELAQQHEQHENVVFLVSHDGNEEIGRCAPKIDFRQITLFLGPNRATLGNCCRKTARRATKRPPPGNPKVSRVTSGYRGLMIQMSWVRLSQKNGGFIGGA